MYTYVPSIQSGSRQHGTLNYFIELLQCVVIKVYKFSKDTVSALVGVIVTLMNHYVGMAAVDGRLSLRQWVMHLHCSPVGAYDMVEVRVVVWMVIG